MPIRNNNTGSIVSTRNLNPINTQREFTSTSTVLDKPPFVERDFTADELDIIGDGMEIKRPIIKLEPYKGAGSDSTKNDSPTLSGADDDEGNALKEAVELSFPVKYEYNKEFAEFKSGLKNVIAYDITPNPFTSAIFYGETGTGKTTAIQQMVAEFQEEIKDRNIHYLTFDYAAIQSSLVGKAEKNINKIKEELLKLKEEDFYVLHSDEIDSMFANRQTSAKHIQDFVNEMIKLMDVLPENVILIGTTNLIDNFDSAIARRFETKIEFKDYDVNYKTKLLHSMQKSKGLKPIAVENISKYKIYHLSEFTNKRYLKEITNTNSEVVKKFKERSDKRKKIIESERKKARANVIDAEANSINENYNKDKGKIIAGHERDQVELTEMFNVLIDQEKNLISTVTDKKETNDTRPVVEFEETVSDFLDLTKEKQLSSTIKAFEKSTARTKAIDLNGVEVDCASNWTDEHELTKGLSVEGKIYCEDCITELKDKTKAFAFVFKDQSKKDIVKPITSKDFNEFLNDETKVAERINGKIFIKSRGVLHLAVSQANKYAPSSQVVKQGKVIDYTVEHPNGETVEEETSDVITQHSVVDGDDILFRGIKTTKHDTIFMTLVIGQIMNVGGTIGDFKLTAQDWVRYVLKKDWIVIESRRDVLEALGGN